LPLLIPVCALESACCQRLDARADLVARDAKMLQPLLVFEVLVLAIGVG
jgi:hypothetical protein